MELRTILDAIQPFVTQWIYKLAVKVAIQSDGWQAERYTWTYASTTTVTLGGAAAGLNVTAEYPVGTKVTWNDGSTKYGYVVGAAFGTNTVLTIAGTAVANATITNAAKSFVDNPVGFPAWFSWTPTITGWTTPPANSFYRFCVTGRMCTVTARQGSSATSNATTVSFTAPITAANINSSEYWGAVMWGGIDNGVNLTTPGVCYIQSNAATINCYKDQANAVWTASGNKAVNFTLSYEI